MENFSIITINLNNRDGLIKTIESVLSQTYDDYEYIIIDGSSTDGSLDVIKERHDHITYWISEKDAGLYDAMNKGIAQASGKYCLFLNSGDYLAQNDVLQKVAETKLMDDIVYGDILYAKDRIIVASKVNPDKLSSLFLMTSCIDHQVQFIKRELFDKYGNYSLKFKIASDNEFFVKLYLNTKLTTKHLPIVITVFDISGISAITENKKLLMAERKKIHKEYFPSRMYFLYYGFTKIRDFTSSIPIVGHLSKFVNKYAEKLIGVNH